MKLQELFEANEPGNAGEHYDSVQQCIIIAWGRLLYLDYPHLPKGPDHSNDRDWRNEAKDFVWADRAHKKGTISDEEMEEEEESFANGFASQDHNRRWPLTKNTVDSVLHSCETELEEEITLSRFGGDHKIRPHSWVSMTTRTGDAGYPNLGKEKTFTLPKGAKVVWTHGLADKDEVIVSTDVLLKHQNEA